MGNYDRSVNAALSESASKFALAEALALDIPAQQGKAGVLEALTEVSEAIIEAGGEPKAPRTLGEYRLTALHFTGKTREVEWADGYSYTAHREAWANGIHPDQFRAKPQTAREIRQENGGASKDGSPENVIAGWSPEQKQAARDRLREEAVEDLRKENVTREKVAAPKGKATPTPEVGSEAGVQKRAIESAMAEVMHFSRSTVQRAEAVANKFDAAMPNPWWMKQVPGSTMYRTHEEQVLGDLDKAAAAIQQARIKIAKVIDKAQATV